MERARLTSNYSYLRLCFHVLIFLVFSINNISAQLISEPNPNFKIDIKQGCSPYSITLTDLVADKNDSVFYYFRNTLDPRSCSQNYQDNFGPCINGQPLGVKNQKTIEYSYINGSPRPEEFVIIQVNRNAQAGQQVSFLNFVTTIPSLPPDIQALVCGDNSVSVIFDFEADFYDYYELDFGDGTGMRTVEKNQPNQMDHDYATGGMFNITVTGRLDNGDDSNCNTTVATINTIEDAPEPRITFLEATDVNSLYLQYETLNPIFGYRLEVDFGSGFEEVAILDVIDNANEFTFSDLRIDNEKEYYELRIQAADNCSLRSATSASVSTLSIRQFLSDVTETFNTYMSWETSNSGFNNIQYFRDNSEVGSFSRVRGDSVLVAIDNCTQLTQTYLQRSSNGAISRSLTIVPNTPQTIELPALSQPIVEFSTSGINVTWEESNFPADTYEILRKKSVNDYSSIGQPTITEWTDNQLPPAASSACYVVRYTDECGNISTLSEEVCLPLVGSLKLPNAFTPNGDNVNDIFKPVDGVFKNFLMTIYNRWGVAIFQTKNSEVGWNGLTSNGLAKPGTYMYQISYTDEDNIPIAKSGTFTLIR